MKISIITITRNNRQGLERTLASVAAQKDVDIDHIIVDGLSTDGTRELLATSSAKIVSTEPRGVYNAINRGIHEANGDIIGLLHAGDVFTNDTVLCDIKNIFSAQDNDYLYGNIYFINDCAKVTRRYSGANCTLHQLTHGNTPPHPSLYMTRKCASHIGDYAEQYKICGDFDMFVRLFSDSSLKGFYFDHDIVAMATGGMSTTIYNRLITNPTERLRVLRAHHLPANPLRMISHYIQILKSRL